MALWDLIAAGIEATMRGTINYLVRGGMTILDAVTAQRATEQVLARMRPMDIEDQLHVRRIADEQARAIHVAGQMQRGLGVDRLADIPISSTLALPPGDTIRYLVIVKQRDPDTGERIDYPIEITSDVPMLRDDVLDKARDMVRQMEVPREYRTKIETYNRAVTYKATIISVSRSQ